MALFERRYGPLLRLAAIVTQDPPIAEDLVNEGFVRLVMHWPKVRGYDVPEAWLRRVVIRDAIKVRARRAREVSVDTDLFDRRSTPDGTAASDRRVDLLTLVGSLPPQERAVVALHYLEDLSVVDTAEVLGIAPGTVKAHLSHARDALRAEATPEERSRTPKPTHLDGADVVASTPTTESTEAP